MKTSEAIGQLAIAIRWLGYLLGGAVLVLALFARDWGVGLILGSVAPVLVAAGWALATVMERFTGSKGS